MGLLRAGAPEPREEQGENNPAQQAQCGCRLHYRLDGPGMIRQRFLCHPTMAGLRRQPDADGAFTLGRG